MVWESVPVVELNVAIKLTTLITPVLVTVPDPPVNVIV